MDGYSDFAPPSSEVSLNDGALVTNDDRESFRMKDLIYEEIANRHFPPTDIVLKVMGRREDEGVRMTFINGHRAAEVSESAPVAKVGITFMAGADEPQVNRMEETGMGGRGPDQKDSKWRVHTAGSLLSRFKVDTDLSIVQTDQTAAVAAKARARARRYSAGAPSNSTSPTALSRIGRDDSSVTIDSADVHIVDNLSQEEWDIESTLIEVDGSSLMSLIFNYRDLIYRNGPALTHGRTMSLLETMIEDARRLCARSPILFRMSIRRHIMKSTDTRYGIDDGVMFRTLTTSEGIREMISLGAAYFNSLDGNDKEQALVRPRFLQMLVLLLALLNDKDLAMISDFLESTYELKADRQHVELAVLKVLPLKSINSKVFLKGIIAAFPNFNPSKNTNNATNYPYIWDAFIQHIMHLHCILPGTISELATPELSWSVKWPEKGFKSSEVFRNLQYAGSERAVNGIPAITLQVDSSVTEVTAMFTNKRTFVLISEDLSQVTCMVPGQYPVVETNPTGRPLDLIISEECVNGPLNDAIRRTNQLVRQLNGYLAGHRRRSISRVFRGERDEAVLTEIKSSGKLTRNRATLNGEIVSVAYKIEGRSIRRKDLLRSMSADLSALIRVKQIMNSKIALVDNSRTSFPSEVKERVAELKHCLDEIDVLIAGSNQNKASIELSYLEIEDEPVERILSPNDPCFTTSPPIWYPYTTSFIYTRRVLNIKARRFEVRTATWLSSDVIELTFSGRLDIKLFVIPLRPVSAREQLDEVDERDIAILAGQYVIIAVPHNPPKAGDRVVNFLRITAVEEPVRRRRDMNIRGMGDVIEESSLY
ncbi:MAG: hypothetical protein M1839_001016 [Geoglossum umbratile]|nr:MAG: hypothetical protein M1839_001016 [Geoglossum umbratile]